MAFPGKKYLSWAISLLMRIATFGRARADSQRMQQMEFGASTQKMGLRFTERLRDAWRRRWIKLKK